MGFFGQWFNSMPGSIGQIESGQIETGQPTAFGGGWSKLLGNEEDRLASTGQNLSSDVGLTAENFPLLKRMQLLFGGGNLPTGIAEGGGQVAGQNDILKQLLQMIGLGGGAMGAINKPSPSEEEEKSTLKLTPLEGWKSINPAMMIGGTMATPLQPTLTAPQFPMGIKKAGQQTTFSSLLGKRKSQPRSWIA